MTKMPYRKVLQNHFSYHLRGKKHEKCHLASMCTLPISKSHFKKSTFSSFFSLQGILLSSGGAFEGMHSLKDCQPESVYGKNIIWNDIFAFWHVLKNRMEYLTSSWQKINYSPFPPSFEGTQSKSPSLLDEKCLPLRRIYHISFLSLPVCALPLHLNKHL